ncbi:ribonucleases P/MRP protein subunit POP1 [Euwallacea fornicatus]|uniref:ribonucleases P/MRP protein subunit POP1 n=1 Tax=Euwallacea fornicatus TaxID=995702 RepID=UPI00338DCBCB
MSKETNAITPHPSTSNVSLPRSITLSTFTAARVKEIQAMRKSISQTFGTKMAFQKLPKHMRRRAMSHVVKRLPRRLREIHINQMKKSGIPPKSKRPSRRHRRRPLYLQADYIRRQMRVKWLNTHIWHAKRFHMVEKWGYKLPKQPCDKSFKACYRATVKHCLVQDLSYIRCIEIIGLYENLIIPLRKIVDSNTGLTFEAKSVFNGKSFGELVMFQPSLQKEDFRSAIGKIQYLWNQTTTDKKALWLFIHPSYYKQVLTVLVELFNVELSAEDTSKGVLTHYGSNDVLIRELEHEIGKFRLTGSSATDVLRSALKPVALESCSEQLRSCINNFPLESLCQQNEVFQNMLTAGFLPPNKVLSVLVKDPRLNLPKKRTKASSVDYFEQLNDQVLCTNLALSPLIDDTVRNFVTKNKVSNAKLCEMRSQCLVPESEGSMENESIIPIILLWRAGNSTTGPIGYSSGWDVICPSCWSQSLFISFIMWGGRAGGLRESESIAFENSQADILSPDTTAGEQEEIFQTRSLQEKFFRLPPNKRTNFNKYAIASPLSFNWKMLLSDWSKATCSAFSVLRDRKLLKLLQEFVTSKQRNEVVPCLPSNCLIAVRVEPINKGICSQFAVICLPLENCSEPLLESKCRDVFAHRRKALRDEHKSLLKKLRRGRKRASKLGKPITKTDVDMLRNYAMEMRKLWLPEPQTIKDSCDRPVMGFIKHGAFSFTSGNSRGLGYIAADSLKALAGLARRDRVLIRNTNSRVYRLAKLDIIID